MHPDLCGLLFLRFSLVFFTLHFFSTLFSAALSCNGGFFFLRSVLCSTKIPSFSLSVSIDLTGSRFYGVHIKSEEEEEAFHAMLHTYIRTYIPEPISPPIPYAACTSVNPRSVPAIVESSVLELRRAAV